jgi:membrane-associated protein
MTVPMDSIIQFIFAHAHIAHWVIFPVLLLAGFNLPISEDLIIVFSAVLAATVIPEHTVHLFIAVFFGCYLSDWICYWIGRKFLPKLLRFSWAKKLIDQKRISQIQNYYTKYGARTLFVGRFIPFGVRNCLFLAAGLSKMSFKKFILVDAFACFTTNSVLFSISYYGARNVGALLSFVKTFNILIFSVFVVSIIAAFWYKRKLASRKKPNTLE